MIMMRLSLQPMLVADNGQGYEANEGLIKSRIHTSHIVI